MKNILVTGGAGFVGSNLCKRLLQDESAKVFCLDDLSTGRKSNIDEFKENKNFEFIEHDIINPIDIDDINEIYNLACPASPPHYQKDPIRTMKICIFGALNMLDLANKNSCKILHASTSEVYGDPLVHPQHEKYWGHVNPNGIRSCYDEGKRAAETLFYDHHRTFNTDIRVIRIFNTYGPNMAEDDGRVVTNFIWQALNNENLSIYGDGSQTRSFQFVDDLVNGIFKYMNFKSRLIGPINLGNPNEFTVKELAYEVLRLIPDSTSSVIYQDLPSDDPMQRRPDITFAKEKLSWEPKIQLTEGLKSTINHFKKILKSK
jgi:UDP-glucuronate decarboxylase